MPPSRAASSRRTMTRVTSAASGRLENSSARVLVTSSHMARSFPRVVRQDSGSEHGVACSAPRPSPFAIACQPSAPGSGACGLVLVPGRFSRLCGAGGGAGGGGGGGRLRGGGRGGGGGGHGGGRVF